METDLGPILLVVVFGLQYATTISVAAQGELITEKSGILNIGIEGVMLMSSFTAALSNVYFQLTLGISNPYLSLVIGVATGVAMNFFFALISTKAHVDQVIAGIGVNIFALGIIYVLSAKHILGSQINGTTPVSNSVPPILVIRNIASNLSYGVSPITVFMFALPVLTYLLLSRTRFGLHIKAVGENPRSAEVAGVSVANTRILATSLGGALLGLAGSFLTVDLFDSYTRDATAGVGFIAIAAVIAGGWNPAYVLAAGLIFGVSIGLTTVVATTGSVFFLFSTIPYVLTVVVLAIASKRLRPPAALAAPYKKE
jgi:ABC-type uncharacterized transport system permease subunit